MGIQGFAWQIRQRGLGYAIKAGLRFISNLGSGGRPPNSIAINVKTWTDHDWSKLGEEWSNDPAWKKGLVTSVLEPFIVEGSRVLEIGPGGGRWTEHLLQRASRVDAVDVTPKCIELCQARFAGIATVAFHLNDGRSLPMIPSGSIDRIWSWDVFVHIAAKDVEPYVAEFARVLAPGGRGLIHHARQGSVARGWRSDMTAAAMGGFCAANGLTLIDQFESWDAGRQRIWPGLPPELGPDTVSVFEKPAAGRSG